MHPAPSVILFTVLSGAGFGLLTFLGLGYPAVTGLPAFGLFAVAYGLAVGGLISSTFHLGRPERALKAFSQWRTSWLSREGWLAVLALVVTGVYALGVIFFDTRLRAAGIAGAALSLATVFATAMIYGQLRTVPRWNSPLTPAYFLSVSVAGGALLSGQTHIAVGVLALSGGVQVVAWMLGDGRFAGRGHSMATATGLEGGAVRLFEPPHTGANYLLKEFVHVIGRRHARKLRIIAVLGMSVLPALLLLAAPPGPLVILVATVLHLGGVAVSRWLFFAEAEHVVGLYYGKR